MTNADLALLEVANWMLYGEVKVDVARAVQAEIEQIAGIIEGCEVVMFPDNHGGAALACVYPSGHSFTRHFLPCGTVLCVVRLDGDVASACLMGGGEVIKLI